MIRINLLSPVDKENLRWEKLNKLVRQATLWIFIAEAVFGAVFLSSAEYLKAREAAVESTLNQLRAQNDTQEVGRIEAGLKSYRQKIDEVYDLQSGELSWTYLLEQLGAAVPAGVRLEGVTISLVVTDSKAKAPDPHAGMYQVAIRGNAKTRAGLLAFEDGLKANALLQDLECADSNYVQASDVDFRYAFYVSQDSLIR